MNEIKNVKDELNAIDENKKKVINDKMYSFFKDFILNSKIYEEGEVAPGFFVRLRALSSEEIIEAESIVATLSENLIVSDVAVRIRSCSILSYAIEKIGDEDIYSEEESDAKGGEARQIANLKRAGLYQNLMKLPPQALKKIWDMYMKAVKRQNEYYENPEKLTEDSENFSEHPSEE